MSSTEPLFCFARCTREALDRIKQELAVLPIRATLPDEFAERENSGHIPCQSLTSTMEELSRILERDYVENEAATQDAAFTFEYWVVRWKPDVINVLTRLFHPDQSGSIFYGITIVRLKSEEYHLLSDE